MSRCFPDPPPPPYYEEGLIESIKKEREKAKKERRKEKKRKKVGQEHEKSERTKHSHGKRKHGKRSQLDRKDRYNAKAKGKATADAVEQLEKSGLTEEREQPYAVQNNYDSSESSQDGSKRRKLVATTVSQSSQASHGSILWIRLPLVKQKGATPPAIMPVVKQKDPTPHAGMLVVKEKEPEPAATMYMVKQRDLKPPATMLTLNQTALVRSRTSEEACFSARGTEAAHELGAANSYSKPSSKRNSRIHEMERQFRELTVKQKDLKPPATMLTLNQTDLARCRTSEEPCFSSRGAEAAHQLEAANSYSKSSSKRNSRIHEMERQFRELTVKQKDLKPPATMLTLNQTDLVRHRTSEEACFSGRGTEAAHELEATNSYSKPSSKRNNRIHEMEWKFRELTVKQKDLK